MQQIGHQGSAALTQNNFRAMLIVIGGGGHDQPVVAVTTRPGGKRRLQTTANPNPNYAGMSCNVPYAPSSGSGGPRLSET